MHRRTPSKAKQTPPRASVSKRGSHEYVSSLTGLSSSGAGSLSASDVLDSLADALLASLPTHFFSLVLPDAVIQHTTRWAAAQPATTLRRITLRAAGATLALLLCATLAWSVGGGQRDVAHIVARNASVQLDAIVPPPIADIPLQVLNATVTHDATPVDDQPEPPAAVAAVNETAAAPNASTAVQHEASAAAGEAAPPPSVSDLNLPLLSSEPEGSISSCVISAGNLTTRSSRPGSAASLDIFLAVPTRGDACVAGVMVEFKSVVPDASQSKLCLSVVGLSKDAEAQMAADGSRSACMTSTATVAYDRSLREALKFRPDDMPPAAFLLHGLAEGQYSLATHVADVDRVSYKATLRIDVRGVKANASGLPQLDLRVAA